MKNILLISSNRLGDCILSSGLHKFFKKKKENVKITLVCGETPSQLFAYCDNIDRLIVLKKKSFSFHWFILWSKIFFTKWFRVVDLRGSAITFFLYSHKNLRFKKKVNSKDHKVEEVTKSIAGKILAPTINLPNNLNFRDKNLRKIKLLKKTNNFVMIAPTANWQGKIWPAERFLELIISLKKNPRFKKTIFILVGPTNEKKLISCILDKKISCVLDLFGKSSLLEIFYIMKLCSFFIGNDSGLMHMASLANIKTIGLFGPSDKEKYKPWGYKNLAISSIKSPDDLMGHDSFSAKKSSSLMLDLETKKVLKEVINFISK